MPTCAFRRIAAVAVVAVWTIGLCGPLLDAHDGLTGDIACSEPVWPSSSDPLSQFERVAPPVDDGHCGLCHLQRAVGHALAATPRAVAGADIAALGRIDILLHVDASARLHVPSRAPPAL